MRRAAAIYIKRKLNKKLMSVRRGVNVQVFLIDILRFIRFQQRMIITQFFIVGTFVLLIAVSIYPLCCNFFFSCRNSQLSLAHPRFFTLLPAFQPFSFCSEWICIRWNDISRRVAIAGRFTQQIFVNLSLARICL